MSVEQSSSVYERAMTEVKKNLKDANKTTESDALDNWALADKVNASKYLQKLQKWENITRNAETIRAQTDLIQAMESGSINPTNYLDGAQYLQGKSKIDFGEKLQYNQFDTQKWFYKRTVNNKNYESVVLINQEQATPSQEWVNINDSTPLVTNKTSISKFWMQKIANWTIMEWEYNQITANLIEGSQSWKDGTIVAWKFDKDTGSLIDGQKTWKDGTVEVGKYNKNGLEFTGKQTQANWKIINFDGGKVKNDTIGGTPTAVEETSEAKETREKWVIIEKLKWTTIEFGDKKFWINPNKISIEKKGNNYTFSSKEFGFEYIKTPIEVDSTWKLITGEIELQKPFWYLWFGPSNGKYTLTQLWNNLKISKKST